MQWSEKEKRLIVAAADRAAKHRLDFEDTDVDYLRYSAPYRFFGLIRRGDWAISCVRDGNGFDVEAPARFLGHETYPWSKGKARHLLVFERPVSAKNTRWTEFRVAARKVAPFLDRTRPRTAPIVRNDIADGLLRLWDTKGRFKGWKPR